MLTAHLPSHPDLLPLCSRVHAPTILAHAISATRRSTNLQQWKIRKFFFLWKIDRKFAREAQSWQCRLPWRAGPIRPWCWQASRPRTGEHARGGGRTAGRRPPQAAGAIVTRRFKISKEATKQLITKHLQSKKQSQRRDYRHLRL